MQFEFLVQVTPQNLLAFNTWVPVTSDFAFTIIEIIFFILAIISKKRKRFNFPITFGYVWIAISDLQLSK